MKYAEEITEFAKQIKSSLNAYYANWECKEYRASLMINND